MLDNDLERVPALVGRHRGDEGRVRRKHPGQVEGRGGGRRLLRLRSLRPQQSDQVVQNFWRTGLFRVCSIVTLKPEIVWKVFRQDVGHWLMWSHFFTLPNQTNMGRSPKDELSRCQLSTRISSSSAQLKAYHYFCLVLLSKGRQHLLWLKIPHSVTASMFSFRYLKSFHQGPVKPNFKVTFESFWARSQFSEIFWIT